MQNHIESRNFLRTLTFFSEEKGLLSNKPPGTITRALPKRTDRGKKNTRGGRKMSHEGTNSIRHWNRIPHKGFILW